MSTHERAELREIILARMSGILHDVYHEEVRGCTEPGIVGLSAFKDHEDLNDLRLALERMDRGGYGLCIWCRHPIDFNRLRAAPTAHFCWDCERMLERQGGAQMGHA